MPVIYLKFAELLSALSTGDITDGHRSQTKDCITRINKVQRCNAEPSSESTIGAYIFLSDAIVALEEHVWGPQNFGTELYPRVIHQVQWWLILTLPSNSRKGITTTPIVHVTISTSRKSALSTTSRTRFIIVRLRDEILTQHRGMIVERGTNHGNHVVPLATTFSKGLRSLHSWPEPHSQRRQSSLYWKSNRFWGSLWGCRGRLWAGNCKGWI